MNVGGKKKLIQYFYVSSILWIWKTKITINQENGFRFSWLMLIYHDNSSEMISIEKWGATFCTQFNLI